MIGDSRNLVQYRTYYNIHVVQESNICKVQDYDECMYYVRKGVSMSIGCVFSSHGVETLLRDVSAVVTVPPYPSREARGTLTQRDDDILHHTSYL